MIDRNHPAVEALGFEGFDHEGGTMHAWRCEYPDRYPGYCTCPEGAVAIVRDNLTADDLRDTPAGQALMAEAKREVAYGLECLATGYDLSGHWEAARYARAAAKSLLEAFPKEEAR